MTTTTKKDPTAAKRTAALKQRLLESGGRRMSLNLDGKRVRKLDRLIKAGKGDKHSDVIRKLIDEA